MISPPILSFLLLLSAWNPAPHVQTHVSIVDDLGRSITMGGPARRIVSLAPSITESLFAIGAGEQVVGVTDYCNYPPEVSTKARVGGMINPSIEAVVNLRPDLIIVSMEGNMRADFLALTGLGIPVFVSNPRTIAGIIHSLKQLGILTGRDAGADSVIRNISVRTEAIKAKADGFRKRALFLVSTQPLIVVGKNTFLNELLELAGADNLAAGLPGTYPAYSRETLLAENPDIILIMSDVIVDWKSLLDLFPEWSGLSALRRHQIHRVEADIVSRPGPRAADGLESLYGIMHERDK